MLEAIGAGVGNSEIEDERKGGSESGSNRRRGHVDEIGDRDKTGEAISRANLDLHADGWRGW